MKVHIGSLDYDLVVTEDKIEYGNPDDEILGLCEEYQCRIVVAKNYPKQTKQQTFWHEVIHAMMMELGQKDLFDDEGFTDSMAKQLHMFFKNNKVEKIYEKLDG